MKRLFRMFRGMNLSALALLLLFGLSAQANDGASECKECKKCQNCPCEKAGAAVSNDAASGKQQANEQFSTSTLLQLRTLFGDPLAGTSLADCCSEEGFLTALTEVAKAGCTDQKNCASHCEQKETSVAETAPHAERRYWIAAAPEPVATPEPVAFQALLPPPLPPCPAAAVHDIHVYATSMTNVPEVKLLRQSARQLESVASDLEDLGKYEEADHLREMVAKLRQQARDRKPAMAVQPGPVYSDPVTY